MVLADISPRASTVEYAPLCICSKKILYVLENTLDKVRDTGTVKTMYMAFRKGELLFSSVGPLELVQGH